MKKKRLLVLIIAGLVVLATTAITLFLTTQNKICKIGFYGLTDPVKEAITEELNKNFEETIEITTIDSSKEITEKEAKNYNLIFTNNGITVEKLQKTLEEFPSEIYNLMPQNIGKTGTINGKKLALPIILDHYEISYYRTYREQCNLGFPQVKEHLNIYLEDIKSKAIFPLYLAGGDDNSLLGFISLIAQSEMTPENYKLLLQKIYIAMEYDNPLPPELKRILNITKDMVENQYLYRKWYETTPADLDFAMKEHKVGAIVTSLTNHRKMPFVIIKYYDSFMYPVGSKDSTGIVAPEVCAIMPKNKANAEKIAESLILEEAQANLSDGTKLAPVNSRAMAHDMQSDDVRFWAASTSGPLPSIIEGSCPTPEKVSKLATEIRNYLQ